MRRAFKILFAVLLLLGAAWGALMLRLAQGPLSVDFLTRTLARSLSTAEASVAVGDAALTWRGFGDPVLFEMTDVRVARTDGAPVLSIARIGVRLSKSALLLGRIEPRRILVYSPALHVVRGADGRVTLNMGGEDAPQAETQEAGQSDFIKGFLEQLGRREGPSFLNRLSRVSIVDGALLYEDRALGLALRPEKTQVDLRRDAHGLSAHARMNLAPGAALEASFVHEWAGQRSVAGLSLSGVVPAQLAQGSEALKKLAGIEVPLSGVFMLQLDENFKPAAGKIAIEGGAGRIAVPGLYDAPVAVRGFSARGHFSVPTAEFVLEALGADLGAAEGGPRVSATGGMLRDADGHTLTLDATLENMPIDALKTWWPENLARDARGWVTGHLSAGTAGKATVGVALAFPAACGASCASPWEDFAAPRLEKLGGKIDFTGIKVDYFPPLMPVLGVDGSAAYDEKSFNLSMTSGDLGDMKVSRSKIAITGLDTQSETAHSKIDIDVALAGPLKTALKLLDSKPLGYPKQLGLSAADAGGNADVSVNFKFPLYEKLQLPEVQVTAKAALADVALPGVVSGMALSGGPFDLQLKDGALGIKGQGKLADMPVTFDWSKSFAGKNAGSRLKASLPLNAAGLAAFGAPAELQLSGTLPAEVDYAADDSGKATLRFKGDATPLGFTLPVLAAKKEPGAAGTLAFTAALDKGALTGFSGIDLATDAAKIKGAVDFASDGKTPRSAAFEQIRAGGTDARLTAARRGSDGYDINVSGAQLDLSPLFGGDETPSDEEAARKSEPLNITMAVDKLMTGMDGAGGDASIGNVRLFLRRNAYRRIDEMRMDAVSGGRPVILRYDTVPQGHSLRFEAYNAGAVLQALGISKSVRGGRVTVLGAPNPRDPGKRNMRGSVTMADFSLRGVPVLGRLLGAMSLDGFMDLLNGKGIAFKKMRADFFWIDRGQPEAAQNVRKIVLKDGQTSGAALGLTFEGTIDKWSNTLDLNGEIIPVSDLNKIVASIPLVGNILTGGGTGVFAATYTVKGPTANADVKVNPLAALAPGILRKVFFEK